jgi:hypothetical protein
VGGTPPINALDKKGAKNAVDAIASALSPDYLVLLDGPDVIPHIVGHSVRAEGLATSGLLIMRRWNKTD